MAKAKLTVQLDVKELSDAQLLGELVRRHGMSPAAKKTVRHGAHFETCIGIGADNTAMLYLSDDDLDALNEQLLEETDNEDN